MKIHTEKSSNLENQYQESLKKIDNLEKTTLEQKELINTLMESLNELKESYMRKIL